MDLWIRNQEKGILLKTNIITFKKFDEGYGIINYLDGKEWFGLGLYKTKERALEVLDEIQENIEKQGKLIILTDERGIPNGSKFFSYVYEMPKE